MKAQPIGWAFVLFGHNLGHRVKAQEGVLWLSAAIMNNRI
jgi:hypothetical protein